MITDFRPELLNARLVTQLVLPMVYYLAMAGYLLFGRASVFIFLFSLWCELLIMLLLYWGLSLASSDRRQREKGYAVFTGSLVVLLFQLIIACALSGWLNEYTDAEAGTALGLMRPISAFSGPVLYSGLVLLFIYGLLTFDFFRRRAPYSIIESGILFQVVLLSVLGLAGILLCSFAHDRVDIVLGGLALIRLALQPLIRRKFEFQ